MRTPTGAFETALDASHLAQVVFLELQFKSGTSYLCSREHNLSWNGFTWLGAGRVGSIEPVGEGGPLEARGVAMTLSAIPAGALATALDPSEYKNRICRFWFGLLDLSSAAAITVVADPVGPFLYRMDTLRFVVGTERALRLTAESRLADWQRPRTIRYNDADQQKLHPGDKFFEYIEQMAEATIEW